MRDRPSDARPPACSQIMAMGAASYRSRSFPFGFFESAGYMKMPPLRSVRWKSATKEPM